MQCMQISSSDLLYSLSDGTIDDIMKLILVKK